VRHELGVLQVGVGVVEIHRVILPQRTQRARRAWML
jgi:hypothetical protein